MSKRSLLQKCSKGLVVQYIPVCRITNNPPGHHGREGFVHLWDYPSISIFSLDLSSTVKWSSQIMMRSSQRFTGASSRASGYAGCCLMKSCSSLMRTICASLAAVPTVHFSRCARNLKISSATSSQIFLHPQENVLRNHCFVVAFYIMKKITLEREQMPVQPMIGSLSSFDAICGRMNVKHLSRRQCC